MSVIHMPRNTRTFTSTLRECNHIKALSHDAAFQCVMLKLVTPSSIWELFT